MPVRPTTIEIEPDERRRLAVELFNHVWTLLEKQERTEREDELMVHAAHASRFLWEDVGEPVNHARGEWQISRAYATLGRPEPAIHHARTSLELCEEHGIADFDLAYAFEALARAHALAGDVAIAADFERRARAAAAAVADDDDRELVLRDLATLPG